MSKTSQCNRETGTDDTIQQHTFYDGVTYAGIYKSKKIFEANSYPSKQLTQ